MRLLNTETYRLQSGEHELFMEEGYAILSHRWAGSEISLQQLEYIIAKLDNGETPPSTPYFGKIRGACRIARGHRIKWVWIDTCCIDKTKSEERAEFINSMFQWYSNARICITYLADVQDKTENSASSREKLYNSNGPSAWFTRGWTLPELLAPRVVLFYDVNWKYMGTKTTLAEPLEEITRISARYLTKQADFRDASIATKMSWMAGRETAKVEDIAYAMLGILGVSMTPQYGEGMREFLRLQKILLKTSTDESLFAWRMPAPGAGKKYNHNPDGWESDEWGILAASPDWFKDSGEILSANMESVARTGGGFSMIQQGILVWIRDPEDEKSHMKIMCFRLNCSKMDADGNIRPIQIYLRPLKPHPGMKLKRIRSTEWRLSDGLNTHTHSKACIIMQPKPARAS